MSERDMFRVVSAETGERIAGDYVISQGGTLKIHVGATGKLIEVTDRVKMQRCTGLRDKRGRLIYEGDVISRDGEIFRSGVVRRVVIFVPEAGKFFAECAGSGIRWPLLPEIAERYEIAANRGEAEGSAE